MPDEGAVIEIEFLKLFLHRFRDKHLFRIQFAHRKDLEQSETIRGIPADEFPAVFAEISARADSGRASSAKTAPAIALNSVSEIRFIPFRPGTHFLWQTYEAPKRQSSAAFPFPVPARAGFTPPGTRRKPLPVGWLFHTDPEAPDNS